MKLASNILNKFIDPRILKVKLRKSTISCLEELSDYINSICSREIRKNYADNRSYVAGVIFREKKPFKTKNEADQYCKCHLFLANQWLKFLIENAIKVNGKASHRRVLKFEEHIQDFMHDVKPFIEYFEKKSNPEYSFFKGSKYYGQQSWQIFRESRELYWISTQDKFTCSYRMTINLSIFSLRQALELKFQRIIGIYAIYNKKFEEPKVKYGYYSTFIEKHLTTIQTKYSSFNDLTKIYKWTNRTIHTGFMPYIWEQWYALELADLLFSAYDENEDGSWSVHGAVKLTNHENLKIEFVKDFCDKYPTEIWCFDFDKPEAVVLK